MEIGAQRRLAARSRLREMLPDRMGDAVVTIGRRFEPVGFREERASHVLEPLGLVLAAPRLPGLERRPLDALRRQALIAYDREPVLVLHPEGGLGLAQRMMQPVVLALAIPRPERIGVHRRERDVAMRVIGVAVNREKRRMARPAGAIERVLGRADELLVGDSRRLGFVERDDVVLHRLLHGPRSAAGGLPDDARAEVWALPRLGEERRDTATLACGQRVVTIALMLDLICELFAQDVQDAGTRRSAAPRRRASLTLHAVRYCERLNRHQNRRSQDHEPAQFRRDMHSVHHD